MRRIASIVLCASLAIAQNTQPVFQASTGNATFSTGTALVVEQVVVKDKAGNPIEGLTAKDFVVTEDKVEQKIAFLEYQKLDDPVKAALPEFTGVVIPKPRLGQSQIVPEKPGDIKYRDRRLLALYFDMSAMPLPDLRQELAIHPIRQMSYTNILSIRIGQNKW